MVLVLLAHTAAPWVMKTPKGCGLGWAEFAGAPWTVKNHGAARFVVVVPGMLAGRVADWVVWAWLLIVAAVIRQAISARRENGRWRLAGTARSCDPLFSIVNCGVCVCVVFMVCGEWCVVRGAGYETVSFWMPPV